ncbi:MAG TPA: UbiA-like polyprenyltransferase [Tepidisphaeraceae bacterium]|jgi:4-hydroxybenzoate polyprenyltransferase
MSEMVEQVANPELSAGAKLAVFAGDIKIAHTVFAMPFALLASFLAARGVPPIGVLALIVVCMVTARTVAMSANRLLDAELDRRNPRTARRAVPSGQLSRTFMRAMLLLCAAAFVGATSLFGLIYHNWLPLIFSLPVLLYLNGYPLMKRFTRLCHYYLGLALGLAPICAWIAVSGRVELPALIMAAAVLCWTAGFDIIYACQDYDSDRQTGVVSVPSRCGISRALWISRLTHVLSATLLIALGLSSPLLGPIYFIGAGLAIALLIVEHSLVKANDLSKVSLAFFTVNGIISLLLGCLGILDVLL